MGTANLLLLDVLVVGFFALAIEKADRNRVRSGPINWLTTMVHWVHAGSERAICADGPIRERYGGLESPYAINSLPFMERHISHSFRYVEPSRVQRERLINCSITGGLCSGFCTSTIGRVHHPRPICKVLINRLSPTISTQRLGHHVLAIRTNTLSVETSHDPCWATQGQLHYGPLKPKFTLP